MNTKRTSSDDNGPRWRISRQASALLFAAGAVGALLMLLEKNYPLGVDWEFSFAPLSEHWGNPYTIRTFTNPPWMIALLPHAWLPVTWGNAINLCLNILLIAMVIRRYGGDRRHMLLVYTSAPFLDMARTNNVDWIPMLALLVPAAWGLPLIAVKPQSLGAVALIWWKRSRQRLRLLLPLIVTLGLSLLIWGFWPGQLKSVQHTVWNFAVWPYGIPLGVYILYRGYQSDDERLAASATPFLVPYLAPYSITGLLAFAGTKYLREAIFTYVAFWAYFIVETRRIELMLQA